MLLANPRTLACQATVRPTVETVLSAGTPSAVGRSNNFGHAKRQPGADQ